MLFLLYCIKWHFHDFYFIIIKEFHSNKVIFYFIFNLQWHYIKCNLIFYPKALQNWLFSKFQILFIKIYLFFIFSRIVRLLLLCKSKSFFEFSINFKQYTKNAVFCVCFLASFIFLSQVKTPFNHFFFLRCRIQNLQCE